MQVTGAVNNHAAKTDSPQKIHEAAQQFESFVIGQMLKSMRDGGESWMGTGGDDDSAGDTAVGMAEEQFAKALSAGGGLGLARLVEAGLQPHSSGAPASNESDAPATSQKLTE